MSEPGYVTVLRIPRYEIECVACAVVGTARTQSAGKVTATAHIAHAHPDDEWTIRTTHPPSAS